MLSLNLAVAIARVSTAQGSTVHWRVSVGAATKIIIAWQQHLIVGEGSTGSAPFRLLFVVERQHRDDECWDDVTALVKSIAISDLVNVTRPSESSAGEAEEAAAGGDNSIWWGALDSKTKALVGVNTVWPGRSRE